jgi:hypothetical protein
MYRDHWTEVNWVQGGQQRAQLSCNSDAVSFNGYESHNQKSP